MGGEIFIFIAFFGFVAFIAYLYFNTRHKERMALIDTGKDAGLFKGSQDPQYMGALKWGLVLVCLGAGAGIGAFLDISMNNDGPFFTLPLLLGAGGAGLIIYYTIAKAHANEED